MYITKQGNLAKTKGYIKFKCPDCGCEFIADNTEYEYDFNQHDGESYEVACPYCHETNWLGSKKNILIKYETYPSELPEE